MPFKLFRLSQLSDRNNTSCIAFCHADSFCRQQHERRRLHPATPAHSHGWHSNGVGPLLLQHTSVFFIYLKVQTERGSTAQVSESAHKRNS